MSDQVACANQAHVPSCLSGAISAIEQASRQYEFENACALQLEINLYKEQAQSAKLLRRLKIMCREWRECIGTPENNKTPGDTLERSENLIAQIEGREIPHTYLLDDKETP